MKMHLFVFKPKETKVYMKGYLCDCTSCLEFNFEACEKTESDAGVVEGKRRKTSTTATKEQQQVDEKNDEEECYIDEHCKSDQIYEMEDTGTYIAMASDDYREPEIHDKFGHTLFPGEMYLNVQY